MPISRSGGGWGPPAAPAAAPSVPAWVSALAVNEWTELSGTNLSGIEPNPIPGATGAPTGKIDAWNSMVVDIATSRLYQVASGGHGDYAGNEVDYLSLNQAAPAWTAALAPTPTASVTTSGSYYADGRPTSRHSYYGVTYDPVGRRVFLLGGVPWAPSGNSHDAISSYNLDANTYNASGTHPNWSTAGALFPGVCAVPATGVVYTLHNYEIGRFVPDTNTWTTNVNATGDAVPSSIYCCSAFDTARGRAFFLGGTSSIAGTYTVGTNAYADVTLSGAASGSVKGSERGMFYCATTDAYYVRASASGATVYKIDAGTFECTTLSTTGGGSVPATTNGPYNKWNYVPTLGVAILVPTYTGNCWALRLH